MSAPNVRVRCAPCEGKWCPRCDGSGFTDNPETFLERMEALNILFRELGRSVIDAVGENFTFLLPVVLLVCLCAVLFGITFGWR